MCSRRGFSIALALLLVAVCLFSCAAEALPVHGAAHACSGENCLVCLCISLRDHLSGLLFVLAGLFLSVCFVRTGDRGISTPLFSGRWTPVCLKVKLSN